MSQEEDKNLVAAANGGDAVRESKKQKKKQEKEENGKAKMSKEEKLALWAKKTPAGEAGDKKEAKKKEEKPTPVFVNNTPKGEKKDMSAPMESAYHPAAVEQSWDSWWEKKGFFTPNVEAALNTCEAKKFIMVIPPPNVTGKLHIGHALTLSIEDCLTRWHRMNGKIVLWVPGTDHAGIATQTVVERMIMKLEGKTRHDYGREAFVKKVWEWKEQYGSFICDQLRRTGSSVDWTREAFTMNDMLGKAVVEAFVRMFDDGLIYRDTRLVSWSPYLKTALSDIEVEVEEIAGPTQISIPGFKHKVEVGVLVHFYYKVVGSSEKIEVATTRIETMLGDVAVAVHPEDPRYKHLQGKALEHPFIPGRKMKIVTDGELVDMSFGTGAVKVTPAHDANDFKCGKKNNLEFINIFTEEGYINDHGGKFKGMHRFEARFEIIKELEKLGLFKGKSPNPMRLGLCSRSGDIIEPMLMPQWWVNCQDMARRSVEAVRNGDLKILPQAHEQTWYHWLENIKDWCISRQLWWGHRIPAYRIVSPVQKKETWVAGRTEKEALERAKKLTGAKDVKIVQDEDVLDTWFSSGLFPFSVFGWPDKTQDMDAFFPTSLLETGHDILFFWVARMVMMSLQLTNKLPFTTVYLHAMVRDAQGRKMSKSLGNVIDPLEVIDGVSLDALCQKIKEGNLPEKEVKKAVANTEKDYPEGIPECGADALRYGLLAYTKQGRNINLDIKRVVSYRFFCNKLWNATKFALMNFPEGFVSNGLTTDLKLSWADQWILHRLSTACKTTNDSMATYNFSDAVTATYNFWLYELCDVYLELLKPRLAKKDEADTKASLEVLYTCLDRGLRLLHPLLPYVTEELYQRIPPCPHKRESICITDYPQEVIGWYRHTIDAECKLLLDIVKQYRSVAAALDVPPKERPHGFIRHKDEQMLKFVTARAEEIATLAKMGSIKTVSTVTGELSRCVADVVNDQCEVYLDCSEMGNLQATVDKITKKLAATVKNLDSYEKKVLVPDYEEKVPEDVRQLNSEKIVALKEEIKGLTAAKGNLERIIGGGAAPAPAKAVASRSPSKSYAEAAKGGPSTAPAGAAGSGLWDAIRPS